MSFLPRSALAIATFLMVVVPAEAQRPEARGQWAINLDTTALQAPTLPEPTVGKNVQASAPNSGHAHFELGATAHPSRSGVLLGSGMMRAGPDEKYNVVVYRSDDGGSSWTQTLEVAREGTVQDPTFATGREGRAYFGAFSGSWMGLYRSVDGGQSWEKTDLPSLDRPWISVGRAGPDAEEHLYLHGTGEPEGASGDSADVAVYRLAPGGDSLPPAKGLKLARDGREMLATGNSALLRGGTVVFPYLVRLGDIGTYESQTLPPPRRQRRPNALLRVAVSTDGGESFTTETVARWYHRFGRGESATMPVLAADTTDGPFSGRVYVAWTTLRAGLAQTCMKKR